MARKKIEEGSELALQKAELGGRILQIRRLFFDNNNRRFAEKIGENEKTLSQICSGDRYGGQAVIQKILDNMPEINANWLMTGLGEMTKNEQRVGDIKNSNVTGVNVHGQDIVVNPPIDINDILSIVEKHQKSVEKFQEQIDRLITIIEKKI